MYLVKNRFLLAKSCQAQNSGINSQLIEKVKKYCFPDGIMPILLEKNVSDWALGGSLRYLGRGRTFDNLKESTAISRDMHLCFLKTFIDVGSTVPFDRCVNAPVGHDEARHDMKEFTEAGLNGAVSSTDCTSIFTGGCDYYLHNNHINQRLSNA